MIKRWIGFAMSSPINSDMVVRDQLNARLKKIEEIFKADALFFCGPIGEPFDRAIKEAIELIEGWAQLKPIHYHLDA